MSARINLVNQKNPNQDRLERIRKLKGIAYSILIFAALTVMIIFGLEYRFSASYVQKQQAQLLSELDQYSDKSAKFFILNSSLSEIGALLSTRSKYHEITKEIYAIKPSDVLISDYQHDSSGIKLSASSPSLQSIDNFLNSLISLSEKEVIGGITLEKLSVDGEAYSVEVVL